MLNIDKLKCKLNKCGPIKSLYEIESFLRHLCTLKNSVCIAKKTKGLVNNKWKY